MSMLIRRTRASKCVFQEIKRDTFSVLQETITTYVYDLTEIQNAFRKNRHRYTGRFLTTDFNNLLTFQGADTEMELEEQEVKKKKKRRRGGTKGIFI